MYCIVLKKKAKKFIDHLPVNEKRRVVTVIERLPEGEDIKRMKGHEGLFRLRVGSYRILYTVDPVHGRPRPTCGLRHRRGQQGTDLQRLLKSRGLPQGALCFCLPS